MSIRALLCTIAIGTLTGCATTEVTSAPASSKVRASWYRDHKTASGELYNRHALTAAHPSAPMNSLFRVTHARKGRSVVVRINDRGPARWTKRGIDLSERAASDLGMLVEGVADVHLSRIQ